MCQVLWIQWHSFASEELRVKMEVNSVIIHINTITNHNKVWEGVAGGRKGHFRRRNSLSKTETEWSVV